MCANAKARSNTRDANARRLLKGASASDDHLVGGCSEDTARRGGSLLAWSAPLPPTSHRKALVAPLDTTRASAQHAPVQSHDTPARQAAVLATEVLTVYRRRDLSAPGTLVMVIPGRNTVSGAAGSTRWAPCELVLPPWENPIPFINVSASWTASHRRLDASRPRGQPPQEAAGRLGDLTTLQRATPLAKLAHKTITINAGTTPMQPLNRLSGRRTHCVSVLAAACTPYYCGTRAVLATGDDYY